MSVPERWSALAGAGVAGWRALACGWVVVALMAGLPGLSAAAVAQQAAGTESGAAAPALVVAQEADLEAAPASDPLPAPQLERAYWHVFLAFGIAWALILGYAVLLNRRVATAERDLARMRERRG